MKILIIYKKINVILINIHLTFADLYNSPCYYYPQRGGDQTRPAFVIAVDLKAGPQGPDFWVKRGTALLLNLAV